MQRTYYCITTMLQRETFNGNNLPPTYHKNPDGSPEMQKHYFCGILEVARNFYANEWEPSTKYAQIWTTKKRAEAFLPKIDLEGAIVEEIKLVPTSNRLDQYLAENFITKN